MRTGFKVTILRQSDNPPSGKAPHYQGQKCQKVKKLSTALLSLPLISRGLYTKNLCQKAKLNSGFYYEVLRRLHENVRRHRPNRWWELTWLLHHDNAASHTSILTHQFLTINKFAVIPHPPYSPDLATCNFFLFPILKFKLIGRLFDNIDEIQAESQSVLDTLTEKEF